MSQLGKRVFWRSLEERAQQRRHLPLASKSSIGSDAERATMPADEVMQLDRRNFLTLSGAMAALAGVEGCIRRPVEKIMPHTEAPTQGTIGVPLHYATVTQRGHDAIGLLVTSNEGRPTKVEGNRTHPSSGGATDAWAQAAVLDLYDADRARQPTQAGEARSFADVDKMLAERIGALSAQGGNGLRILAEPSNSPAFIGLRGKVLQRFPRAKFHSYASTSDANATAGARLAFGDAMHVDNYFDRARVTLALDSDFLHGEPGSVASARRFAMGRRLASAEDDMGRLYVVEPTLTLTGANADNRLPLAARSVGRFLQLLAAELASKHKVALGALGSAPKGVAGDIPAAWVTAVAQDLVDHRGSGLIVVGSRQPPAVHALAHAINDKLGNGGRTVAYRPVLDPQEQDPIEDLRSLVDDMAAGRVDTLFILGGNPIYDAPADIDFGGALGKVAHSIRVSGYHDETAAACTWHIPRAHELETWGDQVARTGEYALQQPLIAPLWGGRSDIEMLGVLAGVNAWRGYYVVRESARARGIASDHDWRSLLQRGVTTKGMGPAQGKRGVREPDIAAAVAALPAAAAPSANDLELVFSADAKMYDGRFANNAWLLETPDPITCIVWDNAATFAPATANALGIENGDLVRVSHEGRSLDIAAWIQPGQAAGTVGLTLGWGRTRAGRHGNGRGFNVNVLRSAAGANFAAGAKAERTGGQYELVQTQEHDRMEDRPLAIDAKLAEYKETPNFAAFAQPDPHGGPLWETQDYSKGHQWGMAIDLNSCTGCNACVVACQAENNIPVVGKVQVKRGREMAWLRIDRYYVGDEANPDVAFQPVACQHCEEAPCENVCPVNATSHSPEGLNDMAYNRCIGTRYCMNNCPYKVRRFNFFNFNLDIPESEKMMHNPQVSLRFRGVMEKCSYCVQRIQAAKAVATRDSRNMADGDVVTACQQVCASEAIVFGDINDPNSAVAKLRVADRDYGLLAEVGTRPRTRYLAKVRNPNPALEGGS
jgi:molybdopterin-containing oxidoreductase family iron-sulfur binding subunit